jgi:hypothetical protein
MENMKFPGAILIGFIDARRAISLLVLQYPRGPLVSAESQPASYEHAEPVTGTEDLALTTLT